MEPESTELNGVQNTGSKASLQRQKLSTILSTETDRLTEKLFLKNPIDTMIMLFLDNRTAFFENH